MSSSGNKAVSRFSTSGEPVRIGLVGLGGHGRTIQRAAREAQGVEVVAVFDLDQDERRTAAVRLDCEEARSYEALLARSDLEAVVLVTPNFLHRRQTEEALSAGKHVLVEKPIANTVRDGRAMVEAAEAAGQILMVGHNMRRSRAARLSRQMLEEGRLGEVVSAEIHFSSDSIKGLEKDAWRMDPGQCPLLPVMQLGIHAIDLMHFLIGPIRRVYAQAESVTTPSGIVDSVTATFRTASGPHAEKGVMGTLVSNYCTPVSFDYRLAGTRGSLRCTPHRFWFRSAEDTDARGEGPAETRDFTEHEFESFRLQMEAFGAAIRSGQSPETDGPAALQALAVVEALQHSVEQDVPEQVPLVKQQGFAE